MRKREPSGDQRGQLAKPGREANFLDSVPLAVTTYRSWSLAQSIRCPSGNQVPSWPISSTSRWGVPAGRGRSQSGASYCTPAYAGTKREDRSGDISAIWFTKKGVGIADVSPPKVET